MNKTRRLFSLHSWFGLLSGVFLLLLGLSGSFLVFRDEIDHLANHTLLTVQPPSMDGHSGNAPCCPGTRHTPGTRSLAQFYRIITDRYPNLDGIAWLNPNARPEEAYDFRLYLNDVHLFTYDLGLISFNPYTGAILREGKSSDFTPSLIEWIYQFHFSFQLGTPGAALTAIFGLTMLVSLLTGLVVYRKSIWKVLFFRARLNRKNWRTLSSDLHRIVGVWALLLNSVIFFTGFWMNLFAFKPASWHNEITPTKPNTLTGLSLDTLYRKALAQMPDLQPSSVYLPTQPERMFRVSGPVNGQLALFGGSNSVSLDGQTGAVKQVSRLSQKGTWAKIEATFFPLHVGNYGGLPVKILYVLIGLTPGLLSITGFLLWWRRMSKPVRKVTRTAILAKSV
ncbi:PepSY-associated TM helix domain-containing protein [Spirosoma flavum]|uniref:PepSY-associated TM helix domain-containing protein n=1 Tax=Spirosoma flavum TaxID=2048557 RepID=A0ABW6AG25_9BACT